MALQRFEARFAAELWQCVADDVPWGFMADKVVCGR